MIETTAARLAQKELSKLLKMEAALYCSNDTCQAIVDNLDIDGDGELSLHGLALSCIKFIWYRMPHATNTKHGEIRMKR